MLSMPFYEEVLLLLVHVREHIMKEKPILGHTTFSKLCSKYPHFRQWPAWI